MVVFLVVLVNVYIWGLNLLYVVFFVYYLCFGDIVGFLLFVFVFVGGFLILICEFIYIVVCLFRLFLIDICYFF